MKKIKCKYLKLVKSYWFSYQYLMHSQATALFKTQMG